MYAGSLLFLVVLTLTLTLPLILTLNQTQTNMWTPAPALFATNKQDKNFGFNFYSFVSMSLKVPYITIDEILRKEDGYDMENIKLNMLVLHSCVGTRLHTFS